MSFTLRIDQQSGLDLLRRSLGGGKRRPMLQAPTGWGKTVFASAIIGSALAKGRRVIMTMPAIQLIDQTVERLWEAGIRDVGVIQAHHPLTRASAAVQVCSVQTLARKGRIPPADLVLIDEAHRWFDFYSRWMAMEEWRRVPFIGLSATPWTKGLGKFYDDLVIAATTADLIKAGHLSPFRVFAPSHPDLSEVKTVAGDYQEDQLAEAMNQAPLTADIVKTWKAKAEPEGRPTLCFCVDRAHAQSVCERLQAANVRAEYADANTPRAERAAIGKRLQSGKTQVVCNVGIFTTGTDWPFVSCIVLARPTQSEMLYLQMIGRGLRVCPGKVDCLILDHSDTTLNLGFVTDIHYDELDDGSPRATAKRKAKKAKKTLPKECPSCAGLKPAGVRKCPHCGFEPKPQSSEGKGELAELTPGKVADKDTKQRWYAMLAHYARRRGYQDGWIAHVYRDKFGVWPRKVDRDTKIEPDAEVMEFLRNRARHQTEVNAARRAVEAAGRDLNAWKGARAA